MNTTIKNTAPAFLRQSHAWVARAVENWLRANTPSSTLAEMMQVKPESSADLTGPLFRIEARFRYPHYWAVYLHDGRGPISPVEAKWLVWYHDPSDDPRTQNGYPVRAADIRRLTREQFIEGMERNEERGYTGYGMIRKGQAPSENVFMYVRKNSGPADGKRWLDSSEAVSIGRAFPQITKTLGLQDGFRKLCLDAVREELGGKLTGKQRVKTGFKF